MLTKKCLSIIIIGIVSIPIGTAYLLSYGSPYQNYLLEKYMPTHLQEMGYTDEDIVEQQMIAPKHGVNHSVYHQHYKVIFNDEPQLEYLYGLTKKGKKVVQFCEKNNVTDLNGARFVEYTTEKTNHSESECIGYLDNRD